MNLDLIDRITGGRLGVHDVTCPLCSELRRTREHRRSKVLRVWRIELGFATYYCAHCGAHGHTHDPHAAPPDPKKLARAKAETAERDRIHRKERLSKALTLWAMAVPIPGTIGEVYLLNRGYDGRLPDALRFLPARGEYAPAMVAAFGLAHEIEPGVIRIAVDAIKGVHLTRLRPDGSDRERGPTAKIMVGQSAGFPIVLAPPNDLLGMAVTEGIEDGLIADMATGLGVWVAGAANRMPALADRIPGYIECVTIYAHRDDAGMSNACELRDRLRKRPCSPEVLIELGEAA